MDSRYLCMECGGSVAGTKSIKTLQRRCGDLEKMYQVEMLEEFIPRLHLNKSVKGPGGKFNGPSLKTILN